MSQPKVKFLALLRIAAAANEELDWDTVSEELNVSKHQLRAWTKEVNKQDEKASVIELIDIDAGAVQKAAEAMVDDAADKIDGPKLHVNPVSGAIEVVNENVIASQKARAAKVEAFKDSVTGLQSLNAEVQAAAGTVVGRIADFVDDENLTARDLAALASALTSVQQAFFNKPTTNIQVNNVTAESGNLLSAFRGRLKS